MSSAIRFKNNPPYVPPKHPDPVVFAVIPIQFVVACDSILRAAREAILNNTSKDHFERNPGGRNLHDSCSVTKQVLDKDYVWPLIVDRDAPLAMNIHKIEAEARKWLNRSPLFTHHRSDLTNYLTAPVTFKPKYYAVDNRGLVQMRDEKIGLRQQPPQIYLDSTISVEALCSEEYKKAYCEYQTTLSWIEKAPQDRIFRMEVLVGEPPSQEYPLPKTFEYNPPGCRW